MASPDLTAIALHRFGLGAAPGEWARASADPRAYVTRQIGGPTALAANLAPSDIAIRRIRAYELARQEQAAQPTPQAGAQMVATPATPPPPAVDQLLYREDATARLDQLAKTTSPFVERLVAFWSNHFAIAVDKAALVRGTAGAFEREAIRPYIFGPFSDLLRAVVQHPAMLTYLDNVQSIGPNSRAARQNQRGLNENLAREILELHTLGADGGYTQPDVTSFARILTGWTMIQPQDDAIYGGRFTFSAVRHEPGTHHLLGKDYDDIGLAQGVATLDDLAHHPATARHLSFKLARHFLSDQPPPALVQTLANVFNSSGGHLGTLTSALVSAPDAWSLPLQKMRSPLLFTAAMSRASQIRPETPSALGELSLMGQPLWNAPSPNGFPDLAEAWSSPENMLVRLDVAARWGRLNGAADPTKILDEALAQFASNATRQAISRAETRAQAIALLFMSPEFQHC